MKNHIWNSHFARRLVLVFVAVVALPLIATVIVLGHIGQEQIRRTTRAMGSINQSTIKTAGMEFQQVSNAANHQTSRQAAKISDTAVKSISRKMEAIQADSLRWTQRDFSSATHSSFQNAMQKSLSTNRTTLKQVSKNMTTVFAQSATDTQKQASRRIERAMRDMINKTIEEQAHRLAVVVADPANDYLNYLNLVAQMPNLQDAGTADDKATLDALVRRYPMLIQVSVMDASGREIAMSASDRVVTAADMGVYPDAPYFKTAMADAEYIGMESVSAIGEAPTLRLAVPIEVYRGKVFGVLTARLSYADIWDEVRNTLIGQRGFAYIVDRDGNPILAPRKTKGTLIEKSAEVDPLQWRVIVAEPEDEVMKPVAALEADISKNTQDALSQMHGQIDKAEQVASKHLQNDSLLIQNTTLAQLQGRSANVVEQLKQGSVRQTRSEISHLSRAIQQQARETERHIDLQMSEATAIASQRLSTRIPALTQQAITRANESLSKSAILILIISCAVGILLALVLASRIVHPVLLLAQGTRAIAEGDLDKRVDEDAPDEIGDLAVAFNKMAVTLKERNAELRDAESQLVQSAKLASLGTLSAGIAHELNQPLAIIRGVSQQLRMDPILTEDMKEDVILIEGQTSRMMKIIKHLRTFCRAGGYEQVEVDVNQVIESCFILIGAQLKSHDIDVRLNLSDDMPAVIGDANELEQVFINLLTNARDALDGRAQAAINITSRVENNHAVVIFSDNGEGIPQHALRSIFDPFFTTKEAGKGTGLGLSISHSIIEKHQGTIEVASKDGAVFTIKLPLANLGMPREIKLAA